MTTVDTPAWGTSPQADGLREWMVVGFFNVNGQTFFFTVKADTAEEAERLVMAEEADPAGEPLITGVLTVQNGRIVEGRNEYAQHLLLDDPRNVRAL